MRQAERHVASRPFGKSLIGKMKTVSAHKIHPATLHCCGALGLHLAHGSTLQSAMHLQNEALTLTLGESIQLHLAK